MGDVHVKEEAVQREQITFMPVTLLKIQYVACKSVIVYFTESSNGF